jgi:hypothetical protein
MVVMFFGIAFVITLVLLLGSPTAAQHHRRAEHHAGGGGLAAGADALLRFRARPVFDAGAVPDLRHRHFPRVQKINGIALQSSEADNALRRAAPSANCSCRG